MRVTLTFDNGPHPDTTPEVLAALADRDIPAVFFIVGSMLDQPRGPALLDDIVVAGHVVGNHSLNHRVPFGDDPDPANVRREIEACEALLGATNERRLFRPFGGGGLIGPHLLDDTAVSLLTEQAYTCVLWNAVPRDWEDIDGWVEVALDQCESVDHAVVVLHDLPTGAMRHLPRFLDELLERGATFHTDFPDDIVPIDGGLVRDLDGLVRR